LTKKVAFDLEVQRWELFFEKTKIFEKKVFNRGAFIFVEGFARFLTSFGMTVLSLLMRNLAELNVVRCTFQQFFGNGSNNLIRQKFTELHNFCIIYKIKDKSGVIAICSIFSFNLILAVVNVRRPDT